MNKPLLDVLGGQRLHLHGGEGECLEGIESVSMVRTSGVGWPASKYHYAQGDGAACEISSNINKIKHRPYAATDHV